MIKAIVKDESELKSLETQKGYQAHFGEGDEAVVGGVRLILIGGVWVNKAEYDKKLAEEAKAKAEAEAKA